MPSQQEIHDIAKTLIEHQGYYNKMSIKFAKMAIIMSDASKSTKRCLKELKKGARL